MSEKELLALPKVGPDEASDFLGGSPSAQYIRMWCAEGTCPFGTAITRPGSTRKDYTICVPLLIRYRRGEIPLSIPTAILKMLESIVTA